MSTMTSTITVNTKSPSLPNVLLRLEGLTVLLGAITLFAHQGGNWLIFALLLFSPDVSMIGYVFNPRVGSITYDIVHFYALPAVLLAVSVAANFSVGIQLALIWFAHIGMDRTCGYGLKYPTEFKDTHLGRI
jgi:hypothetical protein